MGSVCLRPPVTMYTPLLVVASIALTAQGGYAPKCRTVYETAYTTEYQKKCETHYEEQCAHHYETKCRTTYEEVCHQKYETKTKKECTHVYEKKCGVDYKDKLIAGFKKLFPKERCHNEKKKHCTGHGYHEHCEYVNVRSCYNEPVPERKVKCQDVPKKVCHDKHIQVPKKV